MENRGKIAKLTMIYTMLLFIFPTYAYAYMDPGTGSYVFQMIIAMVLGGLFTIKQFWGKITNFFKKQ